MLLLDVVLDSGSCARNKLGGPCYTDKQIVTTPSQLCKRSDDGLQHQTQNPSRYPHVSHLSALKDVGPDILVVGLKDVVDSKGVGF